jgi:hypothetical protein
MRCCPGRSASCCSSASCFSPDQSAAVAPAVAPAVALAFASPHSTRPPSTTPLPALLALPTRLGLGLLGSASTPVPRTAPGVSPMSVICCPRPDGVRRAQMESLSLCLCLSVSVSVSVSLTQSPCSFHTVAVTRSRSRWGSHESAQLWPAAWSAFEQSAGACARHPLRKR